MNTYVNETDQDVKAIYQKRFDRHFREASGYWRLIGNSGLLFTVTVLLILTAIYYEDFIAWIPDSVPVDIILAIVIGGVCSMGHHRTFIKEADLVFLTPLEHKMDDYFSRAFAYNYVVQAITVFALLILFAPLFNAKVAQSSYLFYFVIPILLKGWNLHGVWIYYRHPDRRSQQVWRLYRGLVSIGLIYWFFVEGGMIGYLLGAIFFSALFIFFYLQENKVRHAYPYHWYHIREVNERLESRFYSFVHAFVDVPHLAQEVKQRTWISVLTKGLKRTRQNAYRYLYLHTFLRAGDYFGRTVRLAALGAFFVFWLPHWWAQMIAIGAIILMNTVQLRALREHHTRHFWDAILPLPLQVQQKSYDWLRNTVIIAQLIVMLIAGGLRYFM
ncbi:ABC transporter permease [Caldalkalibacillus salinus]|uniref:ABC transporter permease n=1 Tax=Caldalkalibacillus salinus TaxID=2803787 RepID=UPI001920510D|nr:ABC transporter permease [Caldalkalibacillus salinus]